MAVVPTYWRWPTSPPAPHYQYASPHLTWGGGDFHICALPGHDPINCSSAAPPVPDSTVTLDMIEAEPTLGDGITSGGYTLAHPRAPTAPSTLPIDFVSLAVKGNGASARYTDGCGLPDPITGAPRCGPEKGGDSIDLIDSWYVDLLTTGGPILTEMEPQPPLDSDGNQPFNIKLRYVSSDPADWARHEAPLGRYLFPLADIAAVRINHNFPGAHSYTWTELVYAAPYSIEDFGDEGIRPKLMMVI